MHHAYAIAFLFLLCCFFGYSIGRIYGFTILPDEFGYWSYAAAAAGYDWTGIVSLNSYYSYGYSLILFPVFVLFQDGLTAYRAAVAVNFILLAGTGLLLGHLSQRLFYDRKGQTASLFAAAAGMYPPLMLYARTTMTETLLTFLYVLFCVLLYQYLESRKLSVLSAMLVLLAYIHFVHMRTVSMIAAGLAAILADRLFGTGGRKRGRQGRERLSYVLTIILVFMLFAAGMAVKDTVLGWVYGGDFELSRENDYQGQLEKLSYIVTWEGLGKLAASVAGKILYLGLATYGTGFWGIWHAWKCVTDGTKRRERIFWLFVLLSAAGALLVSAVYTVKPGRADMLAYGRYHEYVFPVLIAAGLYEMWHTCRLWNGMLWGAGMELCTLILMLCSLDRYYQANLNVCMIFGISYLYDAGDEPVIFYLKAFVLGLALLGVVTFLAAVSRRGEDRGRIFFLVVILEIALAMRASAAVTEPGSIGGYRDLVAVDRIMALMDDARTGKVLYLESSDDITPGMMQFMLRDIPIGVLDRRRTIEDYREDEMGVQDLVLMGYRDDFGSELGKRYAYVLSSGHFILYYNLLPQ